MHDSSGGGSSSSGGRGRMLLWPILLDDRFWGRASCCLQPAAKPPGNQSMGTVPGALHVGVFVSGASRVPRQGICLYTNARYLCVRVRVCACVCAHGCSSNNAHLICVQLKMKRMSTVHPPWMPRNALSSTSRLALCHTGPPSRQRACKGSRGTGTGTGAPSARVRAYVWLCARVHARTP